MNAALPLAGLGEFWRNRTLRALALAYGFVWFVTAIKPFNREDWLLENLLVFLALPAMVALYRSGGAFRFWTARRLSRPRSPHGYGPPTQILELRCGDPYRDGLERPLTASRATSGTPRRT